MEVFTFECEWDIGINENIYSSEELLRRDVAEALASCGMLETVEECKDEGYLTIELQEVIDK